MDLEQRMRTQTMGVQSMINLALGEDGGFPELSTTYRPANSDYWFRLVAPIYYPLNTTTVAGIDFAHFSDKGFAEYVSLTGDTQSNFAVNSDLWPTDGEHFSFAAKCGLDGSIKMIIYGSNNYYPQDTRPNLMVMLVLDAEDPVVREYFEANENNEMSSVAVEGFSVWKWYWDMSVTPNRPNWERVY
jgi:hypothetical protein